jgi:hypothetical protein
MVSEGPSTSGSGWDGDECELPKFALVTSQRNGEKHVVAPDVEGGPALCSAPEPEGGWVPAGLTSRLYQIDCHACRERAAVVLAALGEQASTSQGAGNG